MKKKGYIIGFAVVVAVIFSIGLASADYGLDGFVLFENGTQVAGANVSMTNQRTGEVIYNNTGWGGVGFEGYYLNDAGNFPSGYQDGDVILYHAVYDGYEGNASQAINISQGGQMVNITLHETGTEGNASVSVIDGSISFGNLQLNTVKNTVDIGETQVISTAGAGGAQKIEIKLNSSTVTGINNGTTLTFVTGSPSTNEIKCEFKGGDVSSYTALTTTYQTFDDSMPANFNASLDIQLTTPSAVSNNNYYDSYQFEIIVRATLL